MSEDLLIRSCEVVDGRGPRRGSWDVAIQAGVITEIRRPRRARTHSAVEMDGQGATLVPGLVNMHEHLSVVHPGTHEEVELAEESAADCLQRMARNAASALRVGVTAMRLAGERSGLDVDLRTSIAEERVAGPRIWTAGQPLDYAGGGRAFVGAIECSSAKEFADAARQQIERGADYLKVMLTAGAGHEDPATVHISLDEFMAIRSAARKAGRRIAVHTSASPHAIMDLLIQDGVDSIEHCYLIDEATLDRCVTKKILLVLTPLVSRSPDHLREMGLSREVIERMTQTARTHWDAVCVAVQAGARIALGTDLHSHVVLDGVPAPVRELELYEEAGASPHTLLMIASRNGSSWLSGGERLGLVEEGFAADLLMLEENPFECGAAAYRRLRHVFSRGRQVA